MFFCVCEDCFNKHGCSFDNVNKIATPALFKIKISWNKGHDNIVFLHDVTNKILLREFNHIVDMVMWPKFGISVKEVTATSIL